jgi:hypothetical protein
MNVVFTDLTCRTCICFIDDVLVYTTTFEQYEEWLTQVMTQLVNAELKFKPSNGPIVRA